MKIAITADLHLKSKEKSPERWNALSNIVDKMISEDIKTLIIAGDLFNEESQNYSDFDQFCKTKNIIDNQIKFYIIPGNHDPSIKQQYFTSGNISISSKPEIIKLGEPPTVFLFIPYQPARSMGEVIAEYKENLPAKSWMLIGHGDYMAGLRDSNPYEPGIYMPLARNDIQYYNPAGIILGHIHKKMNLGKVYYPGSPCGLDINETGKRSFLILNTGTLELMEKSIDTDYIFFNESLISLPTANEFEYMQRKIEEMIKRWNLNKNEIPGLKIRLKIKGYTSDKNRLLEITKKTLKDFTFYNNEEPDLTEVSIFNDPERIAIVEEFIKEIRKMEWHDEIVSKEDILEKGLNIILKE
jgi:DNA repair exonuclease SbcCD nuclease subunit